MKKEKIEHSELESLLSDQIRNNLPDEIDRCSTHTYVESVEVNDNFKVKINDGIAYVEGTGFIEASHHGDSELDRDVEDQETIYRFKFSLELDIEKGKMQIINYTPDSIKISPNFGCY